jgi:hypothetical protein
MRLKQPPAQPEGAAAAEDTRPLLCIAVSDTGRGMTQQEVAGCFGAGHAAPAAAGGGTGLGLYSACPHSSLFSPPSFQLIHPALFAVSSAFAANMGGKLTVKSSLGKGSTFTLRVPVRVLDEHELEAAAEATATAAETEAARVAAAEEEQRGRAVASAAVAAAAAAAAMARGDAPTQASQHALAPRRRLRILVAVRPSSARHISRIT